MSFSAYPSPADVEALMRSTGYWPTEATKQALAAIQAQIGAEAAKDEWEQFTGWTPFLADENESSRFFDATSPDGFLDLGAGAISVSSVSIGGNPLVLGEGFFVRPANAVGQKLAFTGLQVGSGGRGFNYHFARPNQIEVVARWGRVTEVPGDVYQAILQKAALIVLTQIENLQSVASISQDGFNKAYDVVGIVTQKDLVTGVWSKDFEKIAKRWKRVVC